MGDWILPTVSELLGETDPKAPVGHLSAEQGWHGARRTVKHLLKSYLEDVEAKADVEAPCWHLDQSAGVVVEGIEGADSVTTASPPKTSRETALEMTQGLILTGPLPVFNSPQILKHFSTWVFNVPTWQSLWQLPAEGDIGQGRESGESLLGGDRPNRPITLLPADPLARECFCLVMLPHFSLLFTCQHEDDGTAINFQFSFSPVVIEEAWQLLRARIAITSGHHLEQLDNLVAQFMPVEPRYDIVMEFGKLMWQAIPAPRGARVEKQTAEGRASNSAPPATSCPLPPLTKTSRGNGAADNHDDVDFLRAFAHGIRTPLATIRTYTQLLKRKKLPADVLKHLEKIDRECSEQIDQIGSLLGPTT